MSITSSIRALLEIRGKRQVDLLPVFGLANAQSLSNKFRGERWSASDLVAVAEACGAKLAFILPDGERVLISADPLPAAAPTPAPVGDMREAGPGRAMSICTSEQEKRVSEKSEKSKKG